MREEILLDKDKSIKLVMEALLSTRIERRDIAYENHCFDACHRFDSYSPRHLCLSKEKPFLQRAS